MFFFTVDQARRLKRHLRVAEQNDTDDLAARESGSLKSEPRGSAERVDQMRAVIVRRKQGRPRVNRRPGFSAFHWPLLIGGN